MFFSGAIVVASFLKNYGVLGMAENKKSPSLLIAGTGSKASCGATLLDAKHPLSYGEFFIRYTLAFDYGAPSPSCILGAIFRAFQLALGSPLGKTFFSAISASAALCAKRGLLTYSSSSVLYGFIVLVL